MNELCCLTNTKNFLYYIFIQLLICKLVRVCYKKWKEHRMDLSIENLQKLKSINNIVIFPITIYDINGKALVFDGIDTPKPLPYSFPIKFNKRKKLSIQYGKFNEIF